MDMSSLVSTLLSGNSVSGISQSTNTSQKDAKNVLQAALPVLLNGAKDQSQNVATSEGFANALMSHGQADATDLTSFMQGVDLVDGGKIVNHLLGGNSNAVDSIAQQAGVSTRDAGNIMAAAAPLLMTLLGQQSGSGNAGANASLVGSMASSLLSNLDIGSLLGGLLGGDASQAATDLPTGNTATGNGKKKKKKKAGQKQDSENSGGILNALLKLLRG